MISISVGEGGIILSEPKERVTWGMRPTARCLTRSESDVEFRTLVFRSAGETASQRDSVPTISRTSSALKTDHVKMMSNNYIWRFKRHHFVPKHIRLMKRDFSPALTAVASGVTGSALPFRPHSIDIVQR